MCFKSQTEGLFAKGATASGGARLGAMAPVDSPTAEPKKRLNPQELQLDHIKEYEGKGH